MLTDAVPPGQTEIRATMRSALVLLLAVSWLVTGSADDAACSAELRHEKAMRAKLEGQLREATAKLAAAEARVDASLDSKAATNVCQYAADHATNVSGRAATPTTQGLDFTCEQFPP